MKNELHLWGKKVFLDDSPLLFSYKPGDDWQDFFEVKNGHWECDGEWLIGEERRSWYSILHSGERFSGPILFTFTMKADLPATRDLNAVVCSNWNDETDELGDAYVCGLNGWYEHKSGIEKNGSVLHASSPLYRYEPGREVRMTFGAIEGHTFLLADGELIAELVDPAPLTEGHVGFSAYCTRLKVKDIEVRRAAWEPFPQEYESEF